MKKKEENKNVSNGNTIDNLLAVIIFLILVIVSAIVIAINTDTGTITNINNNMSNIQNNEQSIQTNKLEFNDLSKSIVRSFGNKVFSRPYKEYTIQIVDKKGEVNLGYKGLSLKDYLKFNDGKINATAIYLEKYIIDNKEKTLNYFTKVKCDLYINTTGKSSFKYIKYISGDPKCELHLTRDFIKSGIEYNEVN